MPNSIGKSAPCKPAKPYPDFPLYAHASGRWAKKIKGKTHFFGKWDNWQAAFDLFQEQVHDLQMGRKPRPTKTDAVTVEYLVNKFLAHREGLVASGEIKPRTWKDYHAVGVTLVEQLGRRADVEQLTPADFAKLRAHFAAGKTAVSLKSYISRAVAFFNFAYKHRLVPHRLDTGDAFRPPAKSVIRREKQSKKNKSFTIEELQAIYGAANTQMRCFMLLGLNGGLGNGDIGQLENQHIVDGYIDFPRPKTAIERRFPLWPETIEAIENIRQTKRPDLQLVFLTKYGLSWFKSDSGDDPISKEFRKLCLENDCHKHGRGFYALRHQFRSIAQGCKDREAVDYIMGHADGSVAEGYKEWGIEDDRLQAVVDHVRQWCEPMFVKPPKEGG